MDELGRRPTAGELQPVELKRRWEPCLLRRRLVEGDRHDEELPAPGEISDPLGLRPLPVEEASLRGEEPMLRYDWNKD
jgi:hypothetical protein